MNISRTVTAAAILAAMAFTGLDAREKDQPRIRERITVRPVFPQFDHEFFITFNAPVGLPGVSLGSGTYVFRRITPSVIQVLSTNHKETYAMMQTIPAFRDGTNNHHVFVLKAQSGTDAPLRLTHWFMPGSVVGQEILYPTSRVSTSNAN